MILYAVDVIIIVAGFTLFAYLHSALASFKFKKIIAEKIGSYMAFYRLLYNIIAVNSFLLLLFILPKPDLIIYDLRYSSDIIVHLPLCISLSGIVWTLKYIILGEFTGITHI